MDGNRIATLLFFFVFIASCLALALAGFFNIKSSYDEVNAFKSQLSLIKVCWHKSFLFQHADGTLYLQVGHGDFLIDYLVVKNADGAVC